MAKRENSVKQGNYYRRLCVVYVQTKLPDIDRQLKEAAQKKYPTKAKARSVSELPVNVR